MWFLRAVLVSVIPKLLRAIKYAHPGSTARPSAASAANLGPPPLPVHWKRRSDRPRPARGINRARVAHLIVYTMGLPVFRTLAFTAGFLAQAVLALAIFKIV